MHWLSDRLMHWQLILLAQVHMRLRPGTPSSTQLGFEPMTSRS